MYFDNLFSGKWNDKQEDGSYFIETGAHIFEHILRYLRTGVLPVFYDKSTGHDFVLYQALLEESMYFAIDRLEEWLRKRKYLDAIEIHYLATETQDRKSFRKHTTNDTNGRTFMLEDRFIELTASSNMEITAVPVTLEDRLKWCIVRKEVIFNHDLCVNACLEES